MLTVLFDLPVEGTSNKEERLQVLLSMAGFSLAVNGTDAETRASTLRQRFAQHPAIQATKAIPGLESLMGIMGPLALAAMVSLPFVAPAAAALLPFASITGVFGRRRRYLDDSRRVPIPDPDVLMRRIHAAATRRNVL